MKLGEFLASLTEEMNDRELPLWISQYILDLMEATLARMREEA